MCAQAEGVIHHGPLLDIRIQRGEARLPIFHVDRLKKGDKVLVRPDLRSLAKGDWILLLGRISPTGNQVETKVFDVKKLDDFADLDITTDEQIPVILLAPQLRNLFGLYTSFSESTDLLNQVLLSDPQRFYDLQQVDQVNQAIMALSQGLDQMVVNRSAEQAMVLVKSMAVKFGVSQVDPECFKGNTVNTQCVAVNIVANKNFVLPSSSDLGVIVGSKGAKDLTSFLTDKFGVFSDATDFLSHKFRDQYDFAATFGRPKGDGRHTELFSLARFRSGNIKTAYVYVPAWFKGVQPTVAANEAKPACFMDQRIPVKVTGHLPVMNYWHSWRMAVTDPSQGSMLAETSDVSFLPERGIFQFDRVPGMQQPAGSSVLVTLAGQFGFDQIKLAPFSMALPISGDVAPFLQGAGTLVAGEQGELRLNASGAEPCVSSMTLSMNKAVLGESLPDDQARLSVDLTRVSAGKATLRVLMKGADGQSISLKVLQSRAQIQTVEHADLDEYITIRGERLERIGSVHWGDVVCPPQGIQKTPGTSDKLILTCGPSVMHGASLPDQVTIHHQGEEPAPIQVRLLKTAASPRMGVAPSPNALLIRPSIKAQQWGLMPQEEFFSDDSGLSLLLRAVDGYSLVKGSYKLQLRFVDDPVTAQKPISVPLMADDAHQELRTRNPIRFKGVELPSVRNPLEWRVQHEPSGLVGRWALLGRSVLMLPELTALSCAPKPERVWVHGTSLDLMDSVRLISGNEKAMPTLEEAVLEPCTDGLCLSVPTSPGARKLAVGLHWVNQRVFTVDAGRILDCSPP